MTKRQTLVDWATVVVVAAVVAAAAVAAAKKKSVLPRSTPTPHLQSPTDKRR